jgi:hypothetical protein
MRAIHARPFFTRVRVVSAVARGHVACLRGHDFRQGNFRAATRFQQRTARRRVLARRLQNPGRNLEWRGAMNLERQLIRAMAAVVAITLVAAAELLSAPVPATAGACPLATAPVQRILLFDPLQRHPVWTQEDGGSAPPTTLAADGNLAAAVHATL